MLYNKVPIVLVRDAKRVVFSEWTFYTCPHLSAFCPLADTVKNNFSYF